MAMNLHCFSLSQCHLHRAETPCTTAAQKLQRSSHAGGAGRIGMYTAQQLPSGQPRADSGSPWWSRLNNALAQSGKWLFRKACQLILTGGDRLRIRTRIVNAADALKKDPGDNARVLALLKACQSGEWLGVKEDLEKALSTLNAEGSLSLAIAANGHEGSHSLAVAAEQQFAKADAKEKLLALFKNPSNALRWEKLFKEAWSNVTPAAAKESFNYAWQSMGLGQNSVLFSVLNDYDPILLKVIFKLDKNLIEKARKDLVVEFQSDSVNKEIATNAIRVLEMAGANHEADPENCILLPALKGMDNASIARLKAFVETHCARSQVMHEKIAVESSKRQLFFQHALKDKFLQSLLLLKTAPLQKQLKVWKSMSELSQSARFRECRIPEAVRYALQCALKKTAIFPLVCLVKEIPLNSENVVMREFRLAAEIALGVEENLSVNNWNLLLDVEMNEVGRFVEIKNLNGDGKFKKLSAGWKQEESRRAHLTSCREFENSLKGFLVKIDAYPDLNSMLPDIGFVDEIPSEDAHQILQRIVANTPREKLQRISTMPLVGKYGEKLLAEAKEQLRTPRAGLMDDACLLASMKFPGLPAEVSNVILAELRKRAISAHQAAQLALVKGLSARSPTSWLHGVIVFLDRERCAKAFDAATEDKYDVWNAFKNSLNELEEEEKSEAIEKLGTVFDSLSALQSPSREIKTNEFQEQELDRLHAGCKEILSSLEINPLIKENGRKKNNQGNEMESAVLDYLDITLVAGSMRRLTQYEKDFYVIESRQQAFSTALSRPSFGSEGDLLIVCEQFKKDVIRCSIVIGNELLDKLSGDDVMSMSRIFVQRLREMHATDAQIMVVSRLACQSTSNSYAELCNSHSIYRITEEESTHIKDHDGRNLCLNPFGSPDMHHIISQAENGAIKVRTILEDHQIESLYAEVCFLRTNPEKTSFRAEFEFTVDQYGQMSHSISISERSSREVIGAI